MIALGNNIYRTLDDKFYLGTQQIGKVYKGTDLIYPEEIVINGIKIDIGKHSLDGYIYDIGYSATKNTRFECCFFPDSTNIRGFFGTNHDNKFTSAYTYYLDDNDKQSKGTQAGTTTSYTNYQVKVLNSLNEYDKIEKDNNSTTSAWQTLIANNTHGYKNYNSNTKFSLIKRADQKLSFRYGGASDSGSLGETELIDVNVGDPYVIGFDDISGSKKLYARPGYLGKYYYTLNNNPIPQDIQAIIDEASSLSNTSVFSDTNMSGNLWINGINVRIPNPNVRRPYDSINHTFDDDLIYYIDSGNIGFIYMIIWESGGKKTLYTQHYDENAQTNKVVIYKYVQVSDGQGGYKFRDPDPNTGEVPVDEIIYPFYRCIPVTN